VLTTKVIALLVPALMLAVLTYEHPRRTLHAPYAVVDTSYRKGSILYLESRAHGETVRAGLESRWGGALVELSWNGINPINRFDSGREVQVAFYDGAEKYDFTGRTGVFGWDPVQAGDKYSHGSPVLGQAMDEGSIYIKTQPNEWYPDDKGGGKEKAVLTDTYVEQWISTVPEHWRTFKLHYKIEHFGNDEHENSFQEFPAVYVDTRFSRFIYYAGTAPWTNDSLAEISIPSRPRGPVLYMPEGWGALVNTDDVGLTVYVPGQYPYGTLRSFPGTSGPAGSGTNYYRPETYFSLAPKAIIEGDIYLIVGNYKEARQVVYELRRTVPPADHFAPVGYVDAPAARSGLKGIAVVKGWVFDNVGVSGVDVFVDGGLAGKATYGLPRRDIAREYPAAPSEVGFTYSLNTTSYANGWHVVQVKATDTTGNVALFPPVTVRIAN
jgi:hypothetical protein